MVKNIIIGKILDYEAKDILRKGIAQCKISTLIELVHNKLLSLADASRTANLSEEEFALLMSKN